jgi:hypothetical protein
MIPRCALLKLVPSRLQAARREKALATMTGLVGALILSRAVDDPALSDEILEATANGTRTALTCCPQPSKRGPHGRERSTVVQHDRSSCLWDDRDGSLEHAADATLARRPQVP